VASVPALPGCVSQSDNRDEAAANIQAAVSLSLSGCIDAGIT
jgi:predicted RNase H-like HicB family nuclease